MSAPVSTDADLRREARRAAHRIAGLIRVTPVERCDELGAVGRCEVWLKLENFQVTGSFKIRGAASALTALSDPVGRRGVVTASTGNHGAATAALLRQLGWPGTIVVPRTASPAKLDRLRRLGVELEVHGDDCVDAELFARELAGDSGRTFLPPYNDPMVVSGQGTVALEIEDQVREFDAVLVPVGGGGLAAGVGSVLKAARSGVELIGCQPAASPVMAASVRAGRIVQMVSAPTLSDATAGGLEDGAVTFEICRRVVDRFVELEEPEIQASMRLLLERHRLLVEGAGALPVAAFLREPRRYAGRRVLLVLTGSSVSLETLRAVLG